MAEVGELETIRRLWQKFRQEVIKTRGRVDGREGATRK